MNQESSNEEATGLLYASILNAAKHPELGVEGIKLLGLLSGAWVEFSLLMDMPDRALEHNLEYVVKLARQEPCDDLDEQLHLPSPVLLDSYTEQGRQIFREHIEHWPATLADQKIFLAHATINFVNIFTQYGYTSPETLSIICRLSFKSLAFEIAAQELCDIAIEQKIGLEGWTLGDCISGLSASAGQRAGLVGSDVTHSLQLDSFISRNDDDLDKVASVMTQEAIRLGVPAGSDWRFGLAANDSSVDAPVELLYGSEEFCLPFFSLIQMNDLTEQAVACAKAAGRMLAVAAGGEMPDMPPIIAKPLALSAMTESFKSVFQ